MYKQWCMAMDQGKIPSEIKALLTGEEQSKSQQNSVRHMKAGKTDANSNSCEYGTWRVSVYVEEGLKRHCCHVKKRATDLQPKDLSVSTSSAHSDPDMPRHFESQDPHG
ncbi:cAMP-responsive element-binding protein-like 2 [Myotis davidii]|uniref:cAMP-responsive element-binding protein-like 2 n=1 Tax=Myotis davidii TaxID=225400 RepID=L5M3N6_MYODS|nr:cAMP-responsive element-binding protein-like 2 [Myotis davidii]